MPMVGMLIEVFPTCEIKYLLGLRCRNYRPDGVLLGELRSVSANHAEHGQIVLVRIAQLGVQLACDHLIIGDQVFGA